MVICKKCQTRNSLDSAFCKHCGEVMDAAAVAEEKGKIEELVGDGFRLFNEGRADEARLIAEKALEDLPEYTNALSLMGMCHERAGELNEALLCYERIVDLNPDSSLDKIKITQLRNAMAAKMIEQPQYNGKRALVGAIAATLLVISCGVALAGFISSKSQPEKLVSTQTPATNPNTNTNLPANINNQPNGGTQTDGGTTTSGQSGQTGNQTNAGGQGGTAVPPIRTDSGGVRPLPGAQDNVLRPFGIDPGTIPNQVGSVNDGGQGGGRDTGSNNPPTTGGPTPPTTEDPNRPDVNDPNVTKPPKNDGIIEITVAHGAQVTGGSQTNQNSPNQLQALLQTARQHFLTGKYDLAAKAYEQALRAGADPASTNQRLGQCYEKLNRNSDALQAYDRAVQAAQAQMGSGGNRERLQNLIDSCQQALRVLRGG